MPDDAPSVPSPATTIDPASRLAAEPPECRAEDGIYFADGRVVLLEVEGGVVHVHETTTLAELCADAPDDWIALEPAARVRSGDYVVWGGGTPWESEAWVALRAGDDDALIWLVKLEGVDAVTEVRLDGDAIVARSVTHRAVVEWTIPIDAPEQIVIERRRRKEPSFEGSRIEA
jgi:hypothetical protein